MCRLAAITAALPASINTLLLDRMMLSGNADVTAQRDGWGVTDGAHIIKGPGSYRNFMPDWIAKLNPATILLGHVRNASYGTDLSGDASHPYQFEHFIAAHNGIMRGGTWRGDAKRLINTDSWRLFDTLEQRIETEGIRALDTLLDTYDSDSAFVFLLLLDGRLHIVRGPSSRTLYYTRLESGYLFHTDSVVLNTSLHFLKALDIIEEIPAVYEFPEFTHAVCTYGTNTFDEYRTFTWKPVERVIIPYTIYSGTTAKYTPPPSRATAHSGNAAASATQTNGTWLRSTTTRYPIPRDTEEGKRLITWLQIARTLYPMQDTMIWRYLKAYLGVVQEDFWVQAPLETLEAALQLVETLELTALEEALVRTWNTHVTPEIESALYAHLFGVGKQSFWELNSPRMLIDAIKKAKQEIVCTK